MLISFFTPFIFSSKILFLYIKSFILSDNKFLISFSFLFFSFDSLIVFNISSIIASFSFTSNSIFSCLINVSILTICFFNSSIFKLFKWLLSFVLLICKVYRYSCVFLFSFNKLFISPLNANSSFNISICFL